MRSKVLLAVTTALVPALGQAQSVATLQSQMQASPYITVANYSPDLPQYHVPHNATSQYSGVVYLQVFRPDLPEGYVDFCTGALINNGASILTAAHCLADTKSTSPTFGKDIATSVQGLIVDNNGNVISITANRTAVNPLYTGNVIDQHDVAVINLDSPVTGVQSYSLYQGSAIGQKYTVAGWGLRGTGELGETEGVGSPRKGFNTFDFSGTDPIFGSFLNNQNVYYSDFDSGKPRNDASCWLTGFFTADNSAYCNLGLGHDEVDTAPGDSGGPEFINVNGTYQIAGVTSFGLSFGRTDPNDPTFEGPDVNDLLDSSFGEFAGYTRVDVNQAWIVSATPEPSSLALLGTGLFGLVPMMRRRRKSA